VQNADWGGVWGIFGLGGAPVLGFGVCFCFKLRKILSFVLSLSKGLRGTGSQSFLVFVSGDVTGGCPAATHFLLLRQKKVSKEKATQVRRPFGVPFATER